MINKILKRVSIIRLKRHIAEKESDLKLLTNFFGRAGMFEEITDLYIQESPYIAFLKRKLNSLIEVE